MSNEMLLMTTEQVSGVEKNAAPEEDLVTIKRQKCILLTQMFGSVNKNGKKKKGLEYQNAIEKNEKASIAYWKPFFQDCNSVIQVDRVARQLYRKYL